MPESSTASSQNGAPAPVGHAAPPAPILVSQHFHNQALAKIHLQQQQQHLIAQSQNGAAQTGRAGPAGLGPLPTLVEASHVNALSTATGDSPVGIPKIDESDLTAPQAALNQARDAGYGAAVMEIASEEFRKRWEYLCLASPELEDRIASLSHAVPQAAMLPSDIMAPSMAPPGFKSLNNPAGMGGSWELLAASADIPPEAGGRPMSKSSSRNTLLFNTKATPKEAFQAQALREAQAEKMAKTREAEEWRLNPSFKRAELNLTRLEDSDGVSVLAPSWLELDSPDEGIRLDSEIALHALLRYASYLSVPTFILPPPSSDPARRHLLPHYARAINAALTSGPGGEGAASAGSWMSLALRLPISSPHSLAQILASRSTSSLGGAASSGSTLRASDDWAFEAWVQIRHLCNYSPRLSVLLDLSMPLPLSSGLNRWLAEPVSHLWLPASSFLANAKGFPVLSKAMQALLKQLFRKNPKPSIILSGTQDPPPQHTRGGPTAYLEYLRHLERSVMSAESAVDVFARGYSDWLQAPLQPLMDNLEGSTYEVFERDPVKYRLYEEAVYQALLPRPARTVTVIWVCGAGRGPLVSRCLSAAEAARRPVKVVAVEKNPSALITLQEKQLREWGEDRVQIKFGDMRSLDRPVREEERADILVSELLGSFGDNELSPECLDGACRFLKKTGISIPSSYTSFISPLSSSKLHNEILNSGSTSTATSSGPSGSYSSASASNAAQIKAAETPFVVLFGSVDLPASDTQGREKIQECWTFAHGPIEGSEVPLSRTTGLPISNGHNVRTTSHTFSIPTATLCHGLAGYFEAHLYGNVTLSIHPDPTRGSPDMLSWFPLFFPLKEPLYLPAGSELDVHLWRLTSGKRVWYEWSLESFINLNQAVTIQQQTTGRPISSLSTHTTDGQNHAPGVSPLLAGSDSSSFANAPMTPRIPSNHLTDPHTHHPQRQASSQSSNGRNSFVPGTPGLNATAGLSQPMGRIKIGMSSLQNPNGRSSWVGM